MPSDIDTKLSAARTRLVLDKPFLGALVLRLPMIAAEGDWCRTTATDARAFYYNPAYIAELSLGETQFMLAHEALHCALSHFARREHRAKHRWDVACDFAINPLLVHDGLQPPPGALFLEAYDGMTAEEIYPLLGDQDGDTLDQHLYDNGDGNGRGGAAPDTEAADEGGGQGDEPRGQAPRPLGKDEQERLAVQWRQRLAGAAQQAQRAGKFGGAMARLVDHLLQPQLPWRMLLSRYMTGLARDDFSYVRPGRREGDALLPSLRSAQVDLVVALDTSGSIGNDELGAFLAEVNAIKGQVRGRVTLHACDADLAPDGPWTFEPWEEFVLPREFRGGGGTRFVPVFDWIAGRDRQPDLLVYFTDGEGEYPPVEPPYPVLWLVKGRARVPWGQRVQLN